MKNKRVLTLTLILCLSLPLLSFIVPQTKANTIQYNGVNYYLRSDTVSTFGVYGYGLSNSYTNTLTSVPESWSGGSGAVNFGYQIYLYSSAAASSQITSGVSATATQSYNYTGVLSSTYTLPQTSTILGYQALQINILEQFNGGAWTVAGTFITGVLMTNELLSSTWTFNLYVNLTQTSTNTYSTFYFGNNADPSYIGGIALQPPAQSSIAMWRLSSGDYIGWLLGEYLDVLGDAFYALILFLVMGTFYFRYQHSGVVLWIFVTFGGSGGLALVLIPSWATAVFAAIMLLAAGLLVRRILR